jgi:hypothetical protein
MRIRNSRGSGGPPPAGNGTKPIFNCDKCGSTATWSGPCSCGGTLR